ncbi:GNAT family N-acetyltransferase [Leisingera sp. D0M16]|uniref:GNAT family N-acetyltransferase n=1 Tax=Leisingera coralii TaxID=3351347 RepID=UPI003B75F3F6
MIRPFEPGDAGAILSIWREASAVAHPFLSEAFLQEAEAAIRDIYLPMAETWVAEEAGQAVGFIALIGDVVGGFFVRPAWQGRGHGRALMDHAVDLRQQLQLEVFRDNLAGRRFYRAYGFAETGEAMDQASGHPVVTMCYPAR